MRTLVLAFVQLALVSGFLLDHSPSLSNEQTTNKYVTISEFYTEKQNQHYETERLRQDMERTFSLLSTQVENRLSTLANKINNTQGGGRNITVLHEEVELITTKITVQESEILFLRNKTTDLEHGYARFILFCNESAQRVEDQIYKLNKTSEQQRQEIMNLQLLKDMDPIQYMHVIEQQIQCLTNTTQVLSLKEAANRHDFYALYNSTIQLDNKLRTIEEATHHLELKTEVKLHSLETVQHKTTDNLTQYIDDVVVVLNESKSTLEKLVTNVSLQESKIRVLNNDTFQLEAIENILILQMGSLENITLKIEKKISGLQHLKDIPGVKDVNNLQNHVHALSSVTQNISVHDRSHKEDMLALYQSTLFLQNKIDSLEKTTTNLSTETEQRFNVLTVYQDRTTEILKKFISDLGSGMNYTKEHLSTSIKRPTEQVGLTSCLSQGTTFDDGTVLLFNDIVTQVGINFWTMNRFKQNGKFQCRTPGLYQISVYVLSYSSGAAFAIYKNGYPLTNLYILEHSDKGSQTGTNVAVVELRTYDYIWVQTLTTMYMKNDKYSCLTIVKIS